MACITRSGMLVGPGCMKNCQPRATLIAISLDRERDDTGPRALSSILRLAAFHNALHKFDAMALF
jgi:hypothetical protein